MWREAVVVVQLHEDQPEQPGDRMGRHVDLLHGLVDRRHEVVVPVERAVVLLTVSAAERWGVEAAVVLVVEEAEVEQGVRPPLWGPTQQLRVWL